MQVPRRREKADNVWSEEYWNQFLQELETGQKVSVGRSGCTLGQCILASSPSLTRPSHLQPKKPLVDEPAEKPSQPIEVSNAGKVGGGETAMLGGKGESGGDVGPSDPATAGKGHRPHSSPPPQPRTAYLYIPSTHHSDGIQ